jgi:hypothetical protein
MSYDPDAGGSRFLSTLKRDAENIIIYLRLFELKFPFKRIQFHILFLELFVNF